MLEESFQNKSDELVVATDDGSYGARVLSHPFWSKLEESQSTAYSSADPPS